MNELDENSELTTFFALLENAFPETSVQVGFHESNEAYLNELRGILFTGQDWRSVDFPENENDHVVDAFQMLDGTSKMYYIAAYMREAILDPFYQSGCLTHLRSFCNIPGGIFSRMTPYQRESAVWFCEAVEKQINNLPMMERLGQAMDSIAAKHIKNTVRNTLW